MCKISIDLNLDACDLDILKNISAHLNMTVQEAVASLVDDLVLSAASDDAEERVLADSWIERHRVGLHTETAFLPWLYDHDFPSDFFVALDEMMNVIAAHCLAVNYTVDEEAGHASMRDIIYRLCTIYGDLSAAPSSIHISKIHGWQLKELATLEHSMQEIRELYDVYATETERPENFGIAVTRICKYWIDDIVR